MRRQRPSALLAFRVCEILEIDPIVPHWLGSGALRRGVEWTRGKRKKMEGRLGSGLAGREYGMGTNVQRLGVSCDVSIQPWV